MGKGDGMKREGKSAPCPRCGIEATKEDTWSTEDPKVRRCRHCGVRMQWVGNKWAWY